MAYAEWTQERIEPNFFENIPKAVFEVSGQMMPLVTSYEIEFYEVATAEKLTQRGLA